MNRTTTSSLAVLVLAFGAYIWFYERHTFSTSELSERKRRLVPEFVRERVTEIGIIRETERLVLQRETSAPDTWIVREPFSSRADNNAIEPLLSALEWTDPLRTIEHVNEKQRDQFGLTKPRLRAWFVAGTQRTPIVIGAKDIVEDGIYVQLQTPDRVFVAPKDFVDAFNHPAAHFRPKRDAGPSDAMTSGVALEK